MMDPEIERLVDIVRTAPAADRQDAIEELRRRLRLPQDATLLGEVLSMALSDEEPLVRMEAAEALGEPELVPWHGPLIAALESDDDATVRACAAESLGDAKNAAALAALRAALDDEDGAVRSFAASSLGWIGGATDADALRRRARSTGSLSETVAFLTAACRIEPQRTDMDELLSALGKLRDDRSAFASLNDLEDFLRRDPPHLVRQQKARVRDTLDHLARRLPSIHGAQLRKLLVLVDSL